MIKVLIPSLNSAEIRYTIDALLGVFLGLNYSVDISSKVKSVTIIVRDEEITLKSPFFEKEVILTKENIPKKAKGVEFLFENDQVNLISLFDGQVILAKKKSYSIDILASTFFMLARWEEHVNKELDNHDRFPAESSIAFKFGFLGRPIVNEYI